MKVRGRCPRRELTVDSWPGFPGQAGFTLIELAAVVAILAIVIATGLPAFSRFQKKAALSAEGTKMVHSLRYAQQRSVLERETMEVVFDLDNRAYWIPVVREEIRREPGRGRVRTPRRQKESASFHQKIPSDYTIDLFYYAGVDREVRKGETAVKFYPDGTADEVYITLLRRSEDREDDMRIFIKVSGVTGLVKVHEGRGEYEGWDFFDGRLDNRNELS